MQINHILKRLVETLKLHTLLTKCLDNFFFSFYLYVVRKSFTHTSCIMQHGNDLPKSTECMNIKMSLRIKYIHKTMITTDNFIYLNKKIYYPTCKKKQQKQK